MTNLLTVAEAAQLAGRQPTTIRTWVARAHLVPAGRGPRNALLFDALAVLNCERDCRERDQRGTP